MNDATDHTGTINCEAVEVFADITCPFTHVGLKLLTRHLTDAGLAAKVIVRAWPLEWVNGTPLDATAVAAKIEVLQNQLGEDHFAGWQADRWPTTTIPALNLASAAYRRSASVGLKISLLLRSVLFEDGLDINDPEVLAMVAGSQALHPPLFSPVKPVLDDYNEGRQRGVAGSPHFWIGSDNYFCPSLEIGRDSTGAMTAGFDPVGFARFVSRIH